MLMATTIAAATATALVALEVEGWAQDMARDVCRECPTTKSI